MKRTPFAEVFFFIQQAIQFHEQCLEKTHEDQTTNRQPVMTPEVSVRTIQYKVHNLYKQRENTKSFIYGKIELGTVV